MMAERIGDLSSKLALPGGESDDDAPFDGDSSTNFFQRSANDLPGHGFLPLPALPDDMESQPSTANGRRLPDLRAALKSIAAFWVVYVTLVTMRGLVAPYAGFWEMFERRLVAALVGALLTFLVYLALQSLKHASLAKKVTVAGLLCLPASTTFAAFNFSIFYLISPLEATKMDLAKPDMTLGHLALKSIAEGALSWYFLFAAWAAVYVAMSYASQLRAADRRAAVFAREAQEAQLRALRYQINPHFLFNTLNSLSALILSARTDVAERMIINLSTFFRTTLSADPTADVPLDEEIKLQRLYLDIEQARFPDRLKVEIDIPEALRSARVPILILQPVIENAIKYGVARSRIAVTLRISAYEEAGRLHVKVKDDGTAPPADEGSGTGVGLRNVCERLLARYGNAAGCFHGPDPEGGFTVHVILPIVRD